MIYSISFVVLFALAAICLLYALVRLDRSALTACFLGVTSCGFLWAYLVFAVQAPGVSYASASMISKGIFASMMGLVLTAMTMGVLVSRRVEFFRNPIYWLFCVNNAALLLASFTPLIALDVVMTEKGWRPVHGPLFQYMVVSNFLSIAFFGYAMIKGYRVGSLKDRFRVAYFAKYCLFTFFSIGILNGLIPAFLKNSLFSQFGPLAFGVFYYGMIRLLRRGDELFSHSLLDLIIKTGAFNGGVNIGDNLPDLLRTMRNLFSSDRRGYAHTVEFAGIGHVTIAKNIEEMRERPQISTGEVVGFFKEYSAVLKENHEFRALQLGQDSDPAPSSGSSRIVTGWPQDGECVRLPKAWFLDFMSEYSRMESLSLRKSESAVTESLMIARNPSCMQRMAGLVSKQATRARRQ